jgi:hypothetical protein
VGKTILTEKDVDLLDVKRTKIYQLFDMDKI